MRGQPCSTAHSASRCSATSSGTSSTRVMTAQRWPNGSSTEANRSTPGRGSGSCRRGDGGRSRLEPYVERYWTVEWDRRGLALPAALLHGVVTRRFSIDLAGTGRVVAATFRPGGFTALAGHRVAADAVVPLRTAWGARASTSVRALQRLFRRFVGVGPKRVLQRYRLQDAADLIDTGQVDDLASLAVDPGWFDQSHSSRDLRDAVGVTPSDYLAQAAQATRGSSPAPPARRRGRGSSAGRRGGRR